LTTASGVQGRIDLAKPAGTTSSVPPLTDCRRGSDGEALTACGSDVVPGAPPSCDGRIQRTL
jgi:hypothetical protein